MSAGVFGVARYQTDADNICNVTVQPETIAAVVNGGANTIPLGTVNQEASAIASGGRGHGVRCRKVRLQFTGAAPAGYKPNGTVTIPWLSRTSFAAIQKNQEGTYLGAAVRVLGKVAERVG